MKVCTIIGGADGTGKTSLLGVLRTARHDLGRVLSDEGGAEECLAAGVCFTQETTLSGHRPAVMARRAADAGYRVRLYYVGLDTVNGEVLAIGSFSPAWLDELRRYLAEQ